MSRLKKWDIVQMKYGHCGYKSHYVLSVDNENKTYLICPYNWRKENALVVKFEDLSEDICKVGRASLFTRLFKI